jgi:hypothetical protein
VCTLLGHVSVKSGRYLNAFGYIAKLPKSAAGAPVDATPWIPHEPSCSPIPRLNDSLNGKFGCPESAPNESGAKLILK